MLVDDEEWTRRRVAEEEEEEEEEEKVGFMCDGDRDGDGAWEGEW